MDVIACPRLRPDERVHLSDICNQHDSEDEYVDASRIQDHYLVSESVVDREMALPWTIRREPPRSQGTQIVSHFSTESENSGGLCGLLLRLFLERRCEQRASYP
jgi:hypothetical protein